MGSRNGGSGRGDLDRDDETYAQKFGDVPSLDAAIVEYCIGEGHF